MASYARPPVWHHRRTDTPLGPMTLARSEQGLCGAWFDDQRDAPPADRFVPALAKADDPLLNAAAEQLQAYFEGRLQRFELPLDLGAGTGFQQAVWRAVCAIPPGETRSYGQIAAQIGRPKAARAVGAANGANPIAVLIPCHRLIRSSGALAGYAYGLDRKRALLEKEHNMIINRGA